MSKSEYLYNLKQAREDLAGLRWKRWTALLVLVPVGVAFVVFGCLGVVDPGEEGILFSRASRAPAGTVRRARLQERILGCAGVLLGLGSALGGAARWRVLGSEMRRTRRFIKTMEEKTR